MGSTGSDKISQIAIECLGNNQASSTPQLSLSDTDVSLILPCSLHIGCLVHSASHAHRTSPNRASSINFPLRVARLRPRDVVLLLADTDEIANRGKYLLWSRLQTGCSAMVPHTRWALKVRNGSYRQIIEKYHIDNLTKMDLLTSRQRSPRSLTKLIATHMFGKRNV